MQILKFKFKNSKGEEKQYICDFSKDSGRKLARVLLSREDINHALKQVEKGLDLTSLSNMRLKKITSITKDDGKKTKVVVTVKQATKILNSFETNIVEGVITSVSNMATLIDSVFDISGNNNAVDVGIVTPKLTPTGKQLVNKALTGVQHMLKNKPRKTATLSTSSHRIKSRKKVKK